VAQDRGYLVRAAPAKSSCQSMSLRMVPREKLAAAVGASRGGNAGLDVLSGEEPSG
jgi:hypothetical protein